MDLKGEKMFGMEEKQSEKVEGIGKGDMDNEK